MFTIRFFKHYPDGSETFTVISCPHYELYRRGNGGAIDVVVYKNFTTVDGVNYRIVPSDYEGVEGEPPFWYTAFVENQAGKTIDKIRVRETSKCEHGENGG